MYLIVYLFYLYIYFTPFEIFNKGDTPKTTIDFFLVNIDFCSENNN